MSYIDTMSDERIMEVVENFLEKRYRSLFREEVGIRPLTNSKNLCPESIGLCTEAIMSYIDALLKVNTAKALEMSGLGKVKIRGFPRKKSRIFETRIFAWKRQVPNF
jgi:hypothetical protein